MEEGKVLLAVPRVTRGLNPRLKRGHVMTMRADVCRYIQIPQPYRWLPSSINTLIAATAGAT